MKQSFLLIFQSILFTPSLGVITKTVYNHSKIVARPKIASPTAVGSAQFVSKIEAIKKQEDLKKEAIKKKAELQKQKQELLQKQIEQQKVKKKLSFYTAVEVWVYYGIPSSVHLSIHNHQR